MKKEWIRSYVKETTSHLRKTKKISKIMYILAVQLCQGTTAHLDKKNPKTLQYKVNFYLYSSDLYEDNCGAIIKKAEQKLSM